MTKVEKGMTTTYVMQIANSKIYEQTKRERERERERKREREKMKINKERERNGWC